MVLVAAGSACSNSGSGGGAPAILDESKIATNAAANLRVSLDNLFAEHVVLASSATNAALHGRAKEYKAAADALLGKNTDDITKAVLGVYPAATSFKALWQRHIQLFIDYATSYDNGAKHARARTDLTAYAKSFAVVLNSLNPNLPVDGAQALVAEHITTLIAVIDDQHANNVKKAYVDGVMAFGHMDQLGAALAGAIAKQFPQKIAGVADSKPASLRATLNMLLGEHVYLAASATGAALDGRKAEFNAAAAVLAGRNTDDLSAAIGSVYGTQTGNTFKALWAKHIGLFVDYTASAGEASRGKALEALNQYAGSFGTVLAELTKTSSKPLEKDVVADLVKQHVLTLTGVIDSQRAKNYTQGYDRLLRAIGHMDMIAGALADSIANQFPDKF